jgi:MerR family transcriptional regulator, light-induced transcriptional regulator
MDPPANLLPELADASRRAIVEYLRSGPKSVTELIELTGLRQANVSNHLARLRNEGIVVGDKHGRSVIYRLAPSAAASVSRIVLMPVSHAAPAAPHALVAALQERFLASLLIGSESEARRVVEDSLERRLSIDDLYGGVMQPSMRAIGEKYVEGNLTEAQEHLATSLTERLMGFAVQFYEPRDPCGKKAVVGAVAGNHHTIGLRMLSDIVSLEGWESRFLGANVPTDSFARMIQAEQPRLVLVSCATAADHEHARALAARFMPTREFVLCIGGTGIRDASEALALGADASANGLAQFRLLLERV